MNLTTQSCTAIAALAMLTGLPVAHAQDSLFMPSLTYRTGPFAGGGTPLADGFADYFNMLNERDGGIGGAKIVVEECETAYDTQKGVECYEATKDKGALAYSPLSTDLTLALIPKATSDEIPVLSMGYGLSAAAIGETFPWTFVYPTSQWSQLSAILKYIDANGGLKRRKVGFIYLDDGYGREPIPLLDRLSASQGFAVIKYPVSVTDMQNQFAQWLNVRKERPDWMIMWGWGEMNQTAIKEAVKIRYPLDRFIGNGWAGSHHDLNAIGKSARGYLAVNFSGFGQEFPAVQDILTHVVDKGNSKVARRDVVGNVLYSRGVFNAVVLSEAIHVAQEQTGKSVITAADMRDGLENIMLDEARLKELGLDGFSAAVMGTCADHESAGAVFIQQWDGEDWVKVTPPIKADKDTMRPLLIAAADEFVSDKPDWSGQICR